MLRWLFGVAVATVVLTLMSVERLSVYSRRPTQAARGQSVSRQPRLGPPSAFVAAPRRRTTVVRPTPIAAADSGPELGAPSLLEPPVQPAEVLTFPLAGLPVELDYDPGARLSVLGLFDPVRLELGVVPVDGPAELDELLVPLLNPGPEEIVVLRPTPPRWRADSPVERWRVFGFDSREGAARLGRLAATLLNAARSRAAAGIEEGFAVARHWTAPRSTAGVIHSPPALAGPVLTGPRDRLAMAVSPNGSTASGNAAGNNKRVVGDKTTPPVGVVDLRPNGGGLATPTTLLQQVRLLIAEPATSTWAMRVEIALDAALAVRPNDVEGFARVSLELRRLALEGSDLAELIDTPRAAVLLRRACYGIFRRLAAWDLAVKIESQRYGPAWLRPPPLVACSMAPPGEQRSWERVARCLSGRRTSLFACARVGHGLAREVSPRVGVVTQAAFESMIDRARQPRVAPMPLVSRLEAYERGRSPRLASVLARDLQELQASLEPAERRLGEQVDRQYRNANLRVAVAGELLERLLPDEGVQTTRLNERMGGARVRGLASTESQLSLRLTPDTTAWRLGLEAVGRVTTRAESTSGPVVVRSRGVTRFTATKLAELDAAGLRLGATECRATNQTRLLGVDSRLDAVPVVRRMVRSRAKEKFLASRPEVRRHAERQVEQRVARLIDTDMARVIDGVRQRYVAGLLDRADRLGMAVTPMEVRTTERRLIARLRLAADDQLGAHTPRTRAPSDSLASVQLHESALNNAAAGLGLAGERFTAETLRQRLADLLLAPSVVEPGNGRSKLELRFADEQPLSIAFGDGFARIALSVAEMRIGGSRYRDFRVHATYEPHPVGAAAIVRRTGALEIEGRLRTAGRLKLHGVFGRVLRDDQPITLLAPPEGDDRFDDLMITQMVMDDGWLGLALGPAKSPGAKGERVAVAGRYLR